MNPAMVDLRPLVLLIAIGLGAYLSNVAIRYVVKTLIPHEKGFLRFLRITQGVLLIMMLLCSCRLLGWGL